ncbi:MAG: hypothetical protein KKE44_18585 [Proteobacteria bacterium]|nr:hypothetical protein [Pseudomonadota bacterium]MBU1584741.1 hypothetical protein [Pseudomonadota bacterium]MBU2628804.1 hypothetical protein [Pseudomonadota bacterium]
MKYFKILLIIFFGVFFLSGCNTLGVGIQGPGAPPPEKTYHKPGPPPHAPAHGYRHKHHDGHDLEYDSRIGAYIVVNIPETYFGNNLYIRLSTDGKWLVSTTLKGGWRIAVGNEVPERLKENKGKNKKKNPKKDKKHNKDKNNDKNDQ